ncbi:FAD/NAD(P)-binding domain-containing protein [Microthyrium microscopicum]|uniref:FAD/NAD(P)-binding domain-containing protein n=1 Tax=Microthyrium microscopicum TaxID=703497 RepID=A0A6A6U3X1_9PEZI|nr:FAD/NAD(P)-binding domain-containing protein [Microthyrium microscopicum]
MGYDIIIAGAGIAGLAAATTLSQKGHKVTILESKPTLNEFGASIGILPNGVRCLKAWGLESKFGEVITKNGFLEIRDAITNEKLGAIAHNHKNYTWNINRADYQRVLAEAAKQSGATLLFDAHCTHIDLERPAVILSDGKILTADLIVGADGMRSAVQKSIPKLSTIDPKPHLEQCFRCTVPKDRMIGVPTLDWLLHNGNEMCWTSPGKYVLSWPLPENRSYDVVCAIERQVDLPPGKWGILADPKEMAKDFEDFCPEVRDLLERVDGCVQWQLAELPAIETFRSEDGKIVLIGDACHAMIPHSASGGNSAIEDAAVLSECVTWAFENQLPISKGTEAYETIRKPRVQRMQTASHEGFGFLSAGGDFKKMRDAALAEQTKDAEAEFAFSEEERRLKKQPPADMNSRFPSEPYLQWLWGADVVADAKKYLALKSSPS